MRKLAAVVVFSLSAITHPPDAFAGPPSLAASSPRADRPTTLQRLNPFRSTTATKDPDRKSDRDAATRSGQKKASLRARMQGESRAVKVLMKVNHTAASVGVGAGIAGLVAGTFIGGSALATTMANNLESRTISQVAHVTTDVPAADAKFNALASQVHYVDHETVHVPWPVAYHDNHAQTVAAFHNLTTALLKGELPPNAKYFVAAAGAGEVLSGDLKARYGTTTESAMQVDNDTALLKAKLAGGLSPTVSTPNPGHLPGPSTPPASVVH